MEWCILFFVAFFIVGLMLPHGLAIWEAGIEVLHPKSVYLHCFHCYDY